MVIPDTNVWISFFKGEKKAQWIKDLIIDDGVVLHPYIYGELLLGGIASRAESLMDVLKRTEIVEHETMYRFIKENKLHSRGVGWVDVNILASALAEQHRICTFDANLNNLCREFGCFIDHEG